MIQEAFLFCNWYTKKKLSKNNKKIFDKKFKDIIKKLSNNLKLKNNFFVHRDFHVSNLMFYKKKIAVIDTQDAVYGNIAYDLASLVDDVRYKSSKNLKEKIYSEFVKSKAVNNKNFKNDFEILSVLRNFKIIGIFTRLSIRDKKDNYLKLIPYAWKLIEQRTKKSRKFTELKNTLDKYFSKKKRNKYEN